MLAFVNTILGLKCKFSTQQYNLIYFDYAGILSDNIIFIFSYFESHY